MIKNFAKLSIIIALPVIGFFLIKQTNGYILLSPETKIQNQPAVVIRVIDADTIEVKVNRRTQRVRLIGIDAPESQENPKALADAQRSGKDLQNIIAMGEKATEFVRSIVKKGDRISLEFDVEKTDKYSRLLAYVYLEDGGMLNEIIIKEGYAKVYTVPPNVRYSERFKFLMEEAREKRKGIWDTEY